LNAVLQFGKRLGSAGHELATSGAGGSELTHLTTRSRRRRRCGC
jgi:hypothetical protein